MGKYFSNRNMLAIDGIMSHSNLYVKVLTRNVTIFGDRAFEAVIKVILGHKDPIELVSL